MWYPADPVLGALYRETLARYRTLVDEVAAELPADAPGRDFRLGAEPAGILTLGSDEDALRGAGRRDRRRQPRLPAPRIVGPDDLRRLEPGLADGLAAVRLDIGFPVAPASASRAFAGARAAAWRPDP